MEAATGQLGWSDLYYDNVEHLLWNPDWIRSLQADGTKKSIRLIMQRLRKLEAPLHHAVEMFFTLAPHDLIVRLLDIDPAESSSLRVLRCREWEPARTTGGKASLLELCQPDLLVESRAVHVAIEIKKAKGKSSLEQVLKYAALMLLRAPKTPAETTRKLLFVAPKESFADFWKGKAYADPASLKEALRKVGDPELDRKLRRFGTSLEEVKASLDDLQIGWRSVREVRRDIRREQKQLAAEGPSGAAEVYGKLLSGFETELGRWQDGE